MSDTLLNSINRRRAAIHRATDASWRENRPFQSPIKLLGDKWDLRKYANKNDYLFFAWLSAVVAGGAAVDPGIVMDRDAGDEEGGKGRTSNAKHRKSK